MAPHPLSCLGTAGIAFYLPVAERYERGSSILTSDYGFAERGDLLCVTVVAKAILDRLLYRGHLFNIRGSNYLFREMQQAELQSESTTGHRWMKPSSRESQEPK